MGMFLFIGQMTKQLDTEDKGNNKQSCKEGTDKPTIFHAAREVL